MLNLETEYYDWACLAKYAMAEKRIVMVLS